MHNTANLVKFQEERRTSQHLTLMENCQKVSCPTHPAIAFLSNRRLRVVLDGKSSQKYPVNAGVPQGSILGPTLFLLYINDLSDDVICDIAIYADDTNLYFKSDQASDLWQELELASELECNLRDTVTGDTTRHERLGKEVAC